MLDIRLIRENPEIARNDLKKRNDEEKIHWLDDLVKKDKDYRKILQEAQLLREKRNKITEEIDKLRREGKDFSKKVKEAKEIPNKIKEGTTK